MPGTVSPRDKRILTAIIAVVAGGLMMSAQGVAIIGVAAIAGLLIAILQLVE